MRSPGSELARSVQRWGLAGAAALMVSASTSSSAADESGDYGRLAGDLLLSADVGAAAALGQDVHGGAIHGRVALLYLSTAGISFEYQDGFDNDAQTLRRALAGGVEMRPLFLGRFARDLTRGPAYADLLIDSLSLGLGMHHTWHRVCPPAPSPCPGRDFGMTTWLGIAMPLLPRMNTPFVSLRAAARWSLAPEDYGPQALLTLSLGYQHVVATGLVDAGDALTW